MDTNKDDKISLDEFYETMKTWPAFKDMELTREQVWRRSVGFAIAHVVHGGIGITATESIEMPIFCKAPSLRRLTTSLRTSRTST
jgi:hypothetical protein